MTQIDILLHGIPGRSSHGYLGQASAVLVNEKSMVDVGSIGRRPVLEKSFENVDVEPEDVEDVLLTHVHFDHCDNIDLFPNATIHVYGPEMQRLKDGDLDWATPISAEAMFDNHDVNLFDTGDVINGMEVVPAPGHTEHHVAFILEDDDLTYGFTGDAVKNTRELATMNPMVLYSKEAAIDTLERMAERLDFVIPGHDTPFYIEDGEPIATVDVDWGVNLQFSPASATTTEISSNRSVTRELPDGVNDATARQEFH
ncbi:MULTISPECIES: MBL fold metallo-hydrolase [unclassified Haladaptatus]|uniref:MBL fold metallo-hydrolase n=1 Tax=unclassified Haladaptatus TaxID=2622732 RepID=UPI002FCE18EE